MTNRPRLLPTLTIAMTDTDNVAILTFMESSIVSDMDYQA